MYWNMISLEHKLSVDVFVKAKIDQVQSDQSYVDLNHIVSILLQNYLLVFNSSILSPCFQLSQE